MKAWLIAGEASGDKLGAALMAGLKQLQPGVEFAGVGGPLMQAEGLESLFPMDELSVMGLAEILPKYRQLKARVEQSADAVIAANPDVLITIDSPDFCHRVASRVRARAPGIRIVHYVAPSVWAWRPGRAKKMAAHVDQVLALLPFEPPYMQAAGMRCDFVGHPVVAEPVPSEADIAAFRAEHGLGDAPILLVLPGSRQGEVRRLAPVFGDAVAQVLAARPEIRVVIPTTAGVAETVRTLVAGWPGDPLLLDPRGTDPARSQATKRAAFAAADAAIAASGTVSLELARAATPVVIAYRMNPLTWQILRRLVKLSTVTLVNLVTGRNAIPEFLGPACQPGPIAEAALALIEDEFRRTAQLAAMRECMETLGEGGEPPGLRAARAVLDGLNGA